MNRKNEPNEEALRQINLNRAVLLPYSIARFNEMMCACGDNASVWEWLIGYLRTLRSAADADRHHSERPQSAGGWMLLYAADRAGMTEHGIGIEHSWITNDGRLALEFLEERGAQWRDGGFFVDSDGVCVGIPGAS